MPSTPTKMPKYKKAALWLIIGPSALIFGAYFLHFLFRGAFPTASEVSYFSLGLFLIGALGAMAWLPALIAGIVLLVKNHHAKN